MGEAGPDPILGSRTEHPGRFPTNLVDESCHNAAPADFVPLRTFLGFPYRKHDLRQGPEIGPVPVSSLWDVDLLRAGIPTIVSNEGPLGDLPDDCVIKVNVNDEERLRDTNQRR